MGGLKKRSDPTVFYNHFVTGFVTILRLARIMLTYFTLTLTVTVFCPYLYFRVPSALTRTLSE